MFGDLLQLCFSKVSKTVSWNFLKSNKKCMKIKRLQFGHPKFFPSSDVR